MKVTKTAKKTKIFSLFICFFIAIVLASCASNRQSNYGKYKIAPKNYNSIDEEPFYVQNENSFLERKLSNGIPVIIKKSKNQNNCALRLVIKTIPLSNPIKKSGLEELTLNMMTQGTEKYSSLYISSLEYAQSTVFTVNVNPDFLEYGISSTKENLETVIPIFADTFKTPLLNQESFEKYYHHNDKTLQVTFLTQVYDILNQEDSYFSPGYLTNESEISLKEISDYHSTMLNASRISIIASGNFLDSEIDALVQSLENQFGKLQSYFFPEKKPLKQKVQEPPKLQILENIPNVPIFALGIFDLPVPLSQEYICFGILSLYLDDFLYLNLKEKNNVVLDAGIGILLSKSAKGLISIYDISTKKNVSVFDSLSDNLNSFLSLDSIEKKLDSYKRIYTSFVMSCELSSEKTLDQMSRSLIYQNDAKEYIKRPYQINKITAEEIRHFYENYIQGKICWITNNSVTK